MTSIFRILLSTMFAISLHFFGYGQSQSVNFSNEIEKSVSITGSQVLDAGFEDFVVFWMRRGATTFKQQGHLIKVDRETLKTIDQVPIQVHPELKSIWTEYALAGAGHIYIPAYKLDKKNDILTIYCYKLGESLNHKSPPFKCFEGPLPSKISSLNVQQNESKDLLIFSYIEKKRKEKMDLYHYYVMDKDLTLINSNTIERPFREDNKAGDFLVYDDGVVYINHDDRSLLNVVDLHKNSTTTIKIDTKKALTCKSIRKGENGMIIICGSYSNDLNKINNIDGLFSAEINPGKEEVMEYNTVKYQEPEFGKGRAQLSDAFITESGNVYCIMSKGWNSDDSKGSNCFQIYYISSDGSNWIKDLPIPLQLLTRPYYAQTLDCKAFINKEKFYMVYNDNEKGGEMDANNFKHGKPKLLGTMSLVKPKNNSIAILNVDEKGNVNRETFKGPNSEFLNGLFSVNQKVLYSPVRYINGMIFGPSSICQIKFD